MTHYEMTRYDRQERILGADAQSRLRRTRVVVVGAGGLGAAVIPLIAGAGVAELVIVDHDRIARHNLHRQTLFADHQTGLAKAQVAADRARALNPDVTVRAEVTRLDPANVKRLCQGAVVVDAADTVAVSYTLSDYCQTAGEWLVSASVLGRRGYAGCFCGPTGGPSLRAVFPLPPEQGGSCNSTGVLGPVVAMLGAAQAQMVIEAATGSARHRMFSVDCDDWRTAVFDFTSAPESDGPRFIATTELRDGDQVIDLRHGPMPDEIGPGRVVLRCTTGLRAWRAAVALGPRSDVVLLADG